MSLPLSSTAPTSVLRIVLGVACLVLGIACWAWPGRTIVVLAVILGLQLVVAGVVQMLLGLRLRSGPSWVRPLVVVLGGLVVLAGILTIARPGSALTVVVWLVAAGWLVDGVSEIVSGLRTDRSGGERFTIIAFGVTSVIAAMILFLFPDLTLVLLSQITGVVLIVLGIVALAGAILGRRAAETAQTARV